MKKTKPYFHELPQSEIDKLIAKKRDVLYILNHFKQPDWCNYKDALALCLGCWSLCDLSPNGKRTQISEEFCKDCDCFKK